MSESDGIKLAAKALLSSIEAALALAEYVVVLADDSARTATDPRAHVAIGRAAERVVKALKG